MRIIFAGTPEFSVGILVALIATGHQIVGVYCQPDRPKGRGRVLSACPIKRVAIEKNLTVFQPDNLTDKSVQMQISSMNAEVMVVVAYGQILPIEILQIPKYGCLNIHASLLPRWRGAAPIQRAILAGDSETGVSIMQMDEGLDTGAVLLTEKCTITTQDTAQSLHGKLSALGIKAILKTLANLPKLKPHPQNKVGISYAKKLNKKEAWINWQQSAVQINQQIRAFNPYPIAQTIASSNKFSRQILRILSAKVVNEKPNKPPATVLKCGKNNCDIATGDKILRLKTLQLANKKAVDIKDFNNAYQLTQLFSN